MGFIPIYDGTQIVSGEEERFSEMSKLYHVSEINNAIAVIKKEFDPYRAKDDVILKTTEEETKWASFSQICRFA